MDCEWENEYSKEERVIDFSSNSSVEEYDGNNWDYAEDKMASPEAIRENEEMAYVHGA